jgi:thioredoxin 2
MSSTGRSITVRCQFCQTWNRVDGARAADRPKCGNCSRFILLDRPFVLFEDTFQRTIDETELPVLVDFYADWCGPCKMMAPHVDRLAAELTGQVLVAKLDTDRAPTLSRALDIRSIPTVMVFKGGSAVERVSGALPYAELQRLLSRASAPVA